VYMHRPYGGVVPEIAFRKHLELINPVVEEALQRASTGWTSLGGVAVSNGPGLVGALLVGVAAAKVVAGLLDVPLIGINHLEAHVYANFLEQATRREATPEIAFPLVCLLVSGGHTMLIHMERHGHYQVVGETRDDAAGEAFDKVARHLGLGYPGGPVVDRLARKGNPRAVSFPRAWIAHDSLEFSFSGLKTAVLHFTQGRFPTRAAASKRASVPVEDVCASFQEAVVDVLVGKTMLAAQRMQVTTVLMAGGVACNTRLREKMSEACRQASISLKYPSASLCTDNALMVACAGHYQIAAGRRSNLALDCFPTLPVGS